MHELAVTRGVVDQVTAAAARAGARRVLKVRLLVGEVSSVVPDCVRFYFEEMRRGTVAESAELEFSTAPLRIRCPACGGEFGSIEGLCGCNAGGEVVSGQELLVESIEVE
jgi:hydrogenase nickel incorporation protein HypA/HybF